MARGDCEQAFVDAASADGLALERARVPWLNQRGHLGLPDGVLGEVPEIGQIFAELGGVDEVQAGKRRTSLPGDFLHAASGTFIEIDEHQHFTSYRARALQLYPADAALGFDRDEYLALCDEWADRADRYFRSKAAVGFGTAGRQRQRAYNDSLRDLVTPAMGHPPVIRVAAPDRDGSAAYLRVRDQLIEAVSRRA